MIDEILVSVSPGETRIACLASGKAVELHHFFHGRSTLAGNVYVGRVTRVVPGMGAAFVDIGAVKSGFLALPADADGKRALHEGARVLVQVSREPDRGKGAQLAVDIRIPGHLLVFAPKGNGVHVARRIGDETEVRRLTATLSSFARAEEGWIARTNAAGAAADDLAREAQSLRTVWADIEASASRAAPPALLHGESSPVTRVLRDRAGPDLVRITVDDHDGFRAAEDFLRAYLPQALPSLARYQGRVPLLEAEGVEEDFEAILRRRVALPSGGTLVIERTEALWAIDVNTGRNISGPSADASILATNLEAAQEAARQVRLRDLAGLIVIDFVHMDDAIAQDRVQGVLKAALADDPSPVRLTGFSDLGLVEVSRRRTRPALADELGMPCPACNGDGTIQAPLATAFAALRAALVAEREHSGVKSVRIAVAPAVAEVFETAEGRVGRDELTRRTGRIVDVIADSTIAPDRFKLL